MASTTISNRSSASQPATAPNKCCCPACAGIECLDRPTFFAGQLLNETDLNAEIDYVLEKNRLHNRYLHGPGTVCGLEVTCGDCDGTVNISAGYAIDPCGNDVIVCSSQTFDVLAAIKACSKSRRKNSTTGCQPYQPPTTDCSSLTTQEWCITLEYKESPAQPVTPLINQKTSSSCSCGCGCGGGCSCSGGKSSQKSSNGNGGCGCSQPSSQSTTTQTCQPTRTHEGYSIGVCEEPKDCGSLSALLKTTLFERILQCVTATFQTVSKRFAANTLNTSVVAMTGDFNASGVSVNDAQDTCCRLLLAIDDLFSNSPFPVRCDMLQMLATLKCPQSQNERDGIAYLPQAQTNIQNLIALLFEYIRECICHALLPPCPPDPCDNRLIIACVTVANGKITQICNIGCRQFAGGFPSFFYWLSAIPIVPLLKYGFEIFCCGDAFVHQNSPLVNEVINWMNRVDPSGTARKAFVDGNFALPKLYLSRFGALPSKLAPSQFGKAIPANATNFAPLIGQTLDAASSQFKRANVSYVEQRVASRADIPAATAVPVIEPGSKVVVFTDGAKILDIQPYSVQRQLADLQTQVASLQSIIDQLPRGPAAKKKE